ncbi:uncharacterized protein LOC120414789 isoform X2 [Culex pipiens pallens]|uniref:uncharacterized protein LOC120414789 isoform X2 n=1 Tax=Culex pipiens pallens TaxID=42434 RepID=UPI0022AB2541|nr:uncharacterized protein LOC120414789 isoform X2 [Culex pipiens pallens]
MSRLVTHGAIFVNCLNPGRKTGMKRRIIMATIATITIVALVKVTFAEEQSFFASDLPKVSPVPEDPSTIMIQLDDPRQQKREASSGTPRVMQPYTVIQAYPYRLPTASYPAPATRPPRPKGQNCVKDFLINQLRETNDNINRLLDCIKQNRNCEPNQPEATQPNQPFNPPSESKLYQPCQSEIDRLAKTTTPTTPCEDQPETPPSTTPQKLITFRKEYIKEESEEVDTNRYSSAKRFPTNSCEQSQELFTEKPTPKPTRKRCRKPTATTKKCGCRTSRKPTTTTTTTTTIRQPVTKKVRSHDCKCVYCVDDGTCAGGYD